MKTKLLLLNDIMYFRRTREIIFGKKNKYTLEHNLFCCFKRYDCYEARVTEGTPLKILASVYGSSCQKIHQDVVTQKKFLNDYLVYGKDLSVEIKYFKDVLGSFIK